MMFYLTKRDVLAIILLLLFNCSVKIDSLSESEICHTYCYCDLSSVRCYKNLNMNRDQRLVINPSHFNEFRDSIKYLTIDFENSKTNVIINQNSFANMTSLIMLNLDRVNFREKTVPNLINQANLEEITIKDSNLMLFDENNLDFCQRKAFLKKIV